MWTFSWQFESGLEAFQGRIKSPCSAGQGWGNWRRQRLGMAELGISAARLWVWGCCKWGCRWKCVRHLSYWELSNGLWYLSRWREEGRMTELVPVLNTGFHQGLAGKWWCTRLVWSCFVCFVGIEVPEVLWWKLTFVPWHCLLYEIIHCVISSPSFVQDVHCMQINVVKPISNMLVFEQS